jgi:hypothetical protein
MATPTLSSAWTLFVAQLEGAEKGILKTIFSTLIAQLTILNATLNINNLRQTIEMDIQNVIISIGTSALNTAQSVVTPVSQIFASLPKGSTSQQLPIPTKIPEISNNMQSLYAIIQTPTQQLEDAKNQLSKLKLYNASTQAQSTLFQNQISQLQAQLASLG